LKLLFLERVGFKGAKTRFFWGGGGAKLPFYL